MYNVHKMMPRCYDRVLGPNCTFD